MLWRRLALLSLVGCGAPAPHPAVPVSDAPAPAATEARTPLTVPEPPSGPWERVPVGTERRSYPLTVEVHDGKPLYPRATTGAEIAHWRSGDARRIELIAYRVSQKKPETAVLDCCRDGGTELFLSVADRSGKDPVLLVAWGMDASEADRRALLSAWASRVATYLDTR